jgi:hypothetical protein
MVFVPLTVLRYWGSVDIALCSGRRVHCFKTRGECMMKSRQLLIAFVVVSLVFIFSCQLVANIAQWERGPYIHKWLEEKRTALLFPQYVNNVSDILLWPEEEVKKDRIILEKYALSSFSPRGLADTIADSPDGIIKFGWYADNWVSRQGYAIFNTESESEISFDGFVSEFIPTNHVEVRLNDKVVFVGNLAGGNKTSFTGHTRKGINVVNVTSEQEVIPASLGINSDLRPMAFHLVINR